MQLRIRFTTAQQIKADKELVEKILMAQLARFEDRLLNVELYLEDVNGPRGGLDKHCRCIVQLRRTTEIVIRDIDESIQTLIHRVANRASHAIGRRAERKVSSRKKRMRVAEPRWI